ncbi:MAG: glycosyltransferase family 4 protein, partial [Bryobacteraceae bacterium]
TSPAMFTWRRMSDSGGRALFLSPEAPYPVVGGGPLRTASLLEFLAQRYTVDVILFHDPDAPSPASALPSGVAKRVLELPLPRHSRHWSARVARNLERLSRNVPPLVDRFAGFGEQISQFLQGASYDLAVVEHFWGAPYWPQIAPHCRHTILDLHNIESDWHERCGQFSGWLQSFAHEQFRQAARQLERDWLGRYSLLLATSSTDADRLRRIAPEARTAVYPNAVPLVPVPQVEERDTVVFSGTFDYEPNQSAVRYFSREIWPLLRNEWPVLCWSLVGRKPESLGALVNGDPRIVCTGMVEDAVSHLATAKVAVAPMLAGSGTRLKIIEAWAAARPVVSTSFGAEGLPVRNGINILLADSPSTFAAAVSRLLASAPLRQQIGKAGRALYESEFTWCAAWRTLDEHLKSLE